MNAVEVKDLKKNYKSWKKTVEAVRGISFDIKEGEIFGLLGENGAGKSTTINILSGILTKDSGVISYFGKDIDDKSERENIRNSMNVSSAYFGLTGSLSVYENLVVYAKLFGVKEYKKRIEELISQFQLTELKDKQTYTLSSGENTRLNLCKGFINHPKLLLLDECTVGLDPSIAAETRKFIKEYSQKNKATVLFTSHYMYEVEELCDRIAFMQDGKIIKIDTADNLKKLIKRQTVELTFEKSSPEISTLLQEKGINLILFEDNKLKIEVDSEGDELYRLMHSLFKRGHYVKDMIITRPTLQDIFIHIHKKKP